MQFLIYPGLCCSYNWYYNYSEYRGNTFFSWAYDFTICAHVPMLLFASPLIQVNGNA